MVQQKLKGLLPHVTAIVLFIVISAVYFSPQLQGLKLRQGDVVNFQGASKEISDFREKYDSEPLWTNSMFGGMPTYQISTKNSNYVGAFISTLVFKPLSSPLAYLVLSMLGFYIMMLCFGVNPWMSIVGAVAFGLSSLNLLYLAGGHNTKVYAIAIIPPLVGSLILAYRKNMLLGAVLLAFFVCIELTANHLQMTYYALFLLVPIVLVELYLHIKDKLILKFAKTSGILIVAAFLGTLPTVSNLLTTMEYSKLTTRGKSELTLNPPQTVKTTGNDALTSSYIKEYNLGAGEVWSIISPNAKGALDVAIANREDGNKMLKNVDVQYREIISQQSSYWGEQSFSGGAFYFGATMFVLFILGLIFVRDYIKWGVLFATLLAILLSLKYGSVIDFFIAHFPLFNKFRDTKMFLYLVQIAFPMMGLLFLKEIFEVKIDRKKLLYSLIAINGVLFIIYITPGIWFNFLSSNEAAQFKEQMDNIQNNPSYLEQFKTFQYNLENARMELFKTDMLRTIFFTLLVSSLIFVFALGKLKKNYLVISLGLLILIDLWSVDKRYLNNEKYGSEYRSWVRKSESVNPIPASVADNAIITNELSQNPELGTKISEEVSKYNPSGDSKFTNPDVEKSKIAFRELNFNTNYRVLNLNNPFANSTISYYHKSIGGYHGAKLKKYQELIDFYLNPECRVIINTLQDSALTESRFYGMLKSGIPVLNMLNTKYMISNPGSNPVINPFAFGSCWFVSNIEVVNSVNDEMLALGKTDLKTTAIVNKNEFSNQEKFQSDSTATIKQVGFMPNHYTYKTKAASNQVAVFSEIHYIDGWNAYLDGKKTDYFRANYILRAMVIPAGEHTVEFKFEPKSFIVGERISMVSSIMLLLLVIGVLGWEVRNYFKK
jgi:hypothetical protein